MKTMLIALAMLATFHIALPAVAQVTPAPSSPAPAAIEGKATDDGAPPPSTTSAATPSTAATPAAPTSPQLVSADKISNGDTSWMLTSTALVLMMTIPGLALFYGGMVRKKNVLATLMQSFAITCLASVLWWSSDTRSHSRRATASSAASIASS